MGPQDGESLRHQGTGRGELLPSSPRDFAWLIDRAARQRSASIIDLGGEASSLDDLIGQGYRLPFREMLDDIELNMIHELIHLEFAWLPWSEASCSTEEHAVNGIQKHC